MKVDAIFKVNIDTKRVYGLDILRAFAILVVLYGHGRHLIEPYIRQDLYMLFAFDGVTSFFVLSGFLIGGILIKIMDQTDFKIKDLTDFWARRWYRTLPNYYLVLVILTVLTYLFKGFVANPLFFIFSQNLYQPVATNFFFPEAWSLSIEEWFYLLIPFVLFLMLRLFKNKREVFFWMIIFVLLGVTCFRTYKAVLLNCDTQCWVNNIRQLVVTRLDSMMFGVLGAYLKYYRTDIWTKHIKERFFMGLLLILAPQVYDYAIGGMFFKNYLSLSFASLGTLLLLPMLSTIKSGRGFIYKWITIISLISYSLYLLHYSFVEDFLLTVLPGKMAVFNDPGPLISFSKYALFWVLSVCFSILLYKYYEVPMTSLRDRKKTRH